MNGPKSHPSSAQRGQGITIIFSSANMKTNIKLKYWAYIHTNGEILVKRYLSPEDLTDADESPFVRKRTDMFYAHTRDEAEQIANRLLDPTDLEMPLTPR